ncbi:MAG: hypothetical protein ABIZ72_02605 [Candidatus Limnocylindrales bacterium]
MPLAGGLIVLVAGWAVMSSRPGWHGENVHLVDGYWLATESPCAEGGPGVECRFVTEAALRLDSGSTTDHVLATAVAAELPSLYINERGDRTYMRTSVGIDTLKAVVLHFTDGTRRVVGLRCYLPHTSDGALVVGETDCRPDRLLTWREDQSPSAGS